MFYPDQARYARIAAEELGVEFCDLDQGNGYLFAVRGRGKRFLSGAGSVCSYPINSASSYTIARDKAHTKSILSQHGIPVIPGRHFFLTADYEKLRNPGHESSDAGAYAETVGFPVFCKPLAGGRGNFAEIVRDAGELRGYMEHVSTRYDAFLIERLMSGDEYRVLVHDGTAVYSALKRLPVVRADGISPVRRLLEQLNRRLEGTGVSPHGHSSLSEYDLDDVPPAGTTITLAGRRNLSVTGEVESLATDVPGPLKHVAASACEALGLRLGAVDLFDVSGEHDLSELVVIEVNANPGLSALEQAGRLDLVVRLWSSMIREALER